MPNQRQRQSSKCGRKFDTRPWSLARNAKKLQTCQPVAADFSDPKLIFGVFWADFKRFNVKFGVFMLILGLYPLTFLEAMLTL